MNTIDQFQAFVDFISNIDQQKATIAQLKDATKQAQNAWTILSKGQDLAKWEAALQAKQDKMASDAISSQQVLDGRSKQLDARSQSLDIREANIVAMERDNKTIAAQLRDAQVQQDRVAQDLAKKEAALNSQIDMYNKMVADLAAKQEALSKVFK